MNQCNTTVVSMEQQSEMVNCLSCAADAGLKVMAVCSVFEMYSACLILCLDSTIILRGFPRTSSLLPDLSTVQAKKTDTKKRSGFVHRSTVAHAIRVSAVGVIPAKARNLRVD